MRMTRRWWLPALIALLGLALVLAPAPFSAAPPADRTFRIEARSFEYTPPTLAVNPGDRVTLELVSTDAAHGLYLDGYGLNVTAVPGQTARLTFTADKTGSFRFRCSVTCGPLHPFMIGKLSVGPNWLLWRGVGLAALAALASLAGQSLTRA
jgi:heme/copper-type cytochrome/quinol oxidase subunit 2